MNDQVRDIKQYAICTKRLIEPTTGEILFLEGEIADFATVHYRIDRLNGWLSHDFLHEGCGKAKYRPIEFRNHFHVSQYACAIASRVQLKHGYATWVITDGKSEFKQMASKGETVLITGIVYHLGRQYYQVMTLRERPDYFMILPNQVY